MTTRTVPLTFTCGQAQLVGLLHLPEEPRSRGVVLVGGAPQYRVGSHRQFVLLARDLAAAGFPVLRFDYRGMGDSDGDFAGFENIADDIRAAIDTIFARVPGLREVVLWGLCDGASAIAFYAPGDERVSGIILVNPWVRSEDSLAEAHLTHYYRWRLLSPEFWRKLASGKIDLLGSAGDLLSTLRTLLAGHARRRTAARGPAPLPRRVAESIREGQGRMLIVLSGNDVIAREFDSAVLNSEPMRGWLDVAPITLRRLDPANHTYSTRPWRAQVHQWIADWLEQDASN